MKRLDPVHTRVSHEARLDGTVGAVVHRAGEGDWSGPGTTQRDRAVSARDHGWGRFAFWKHGKQSRYASGT